MTKHEKSFPGSYFKKSGWNMAYHEGAQWGAVKDVEELQRLSEEVVRLTERLRSRVEEQWKMLIEDTIVGPWRDLKDRPIIKDPVLVLFSDSTLQVCRKTPEGEWLPIQPEGEPIACAEILK